MKAVCRRLACTVPLGLLAVSACCAEPQAQSKGGIPQKVALGAFTIEVPAAWKPLGLSEMASFREQMQAQSKEIYRRYNSGAEDQSRKLDLVAYVSPDGAWLVGMVLVVPAKADLIGDLKSEAANKAKWGIQQGYIKWASDAKAITRDGFEGFVLEMENAKGTHDFAGGLTHSSRRTEVVAVQMLGAPADAKSAQTFEKLLSSVSLARQKIR